MRFRLSIRALMAVVILVAIVVAAMRNATEVWANLVFNLTVLSLLMASFKARYTRGAASAWWFGFALCGSAHLILTIATMAVNRTETYLETPVDALLRAIPPVILKTLLQADSNNPWVTGMSRFLILKSVLTIPNALVGAALFRFFAIRAGVCRRPGGGDQR